MQPSAFTGLLSFVLAYALLAVMPGPNFLVVARASASRQTHASLHAAFGVACGASLLAMTSASVAGQLTESRSAAMLAHSLFAVLLLVAGWRTMTRGARAASRTRQDAWAKAGFFGLGFLTSLANPVSALFFGSYALAGRAAGSHLSAAEVAGAVFLVALLWFGGVGLMLSTAPLRQFHERHARSLDRIIGLALIVFACGSFFNLPPV